MKTFLIGLVLALSLSASIACAADKVIAESAEMASPLMNGQSIPDVFTRTLDGEQKKLAEVLTGKKSVLFFYRGGWCPFCNTQMGQLKQLEPKLKALGFQLIGISTDSPEDLQKSASEMALNYQLLSDYNSVVSQAFGLAFFTSKKVTDRYLAKMELTNPLQKNAAGQPRLVLPVPAIYVIDKNGLVQFNYVNPNYKVRLHPELLLKAAELVK